LTNNDDHTQDGVTIKSIVKKPTDENSNMKLSHNNYQNSQHYKYKNEKSEYYKKYYDSKYDKYYKRAIKNKSSNFEKRQEVQIV
jgi:CRISPR/Cas system-associated exonuclease Cas4 (RecB family)